MNIGRISGYNFNGTQKTDRRMKIVREPYYLEKERGTLTQYIAPKTGKIVGFVKKLDNGQEYGAFVYENTQKDSYQPWENFISWEGPTPDGKILVKGNLLHHFFSDIPMRYIPGHRPNKRVLIEKLYENGILS